MMQSNGKLKFDTIQDKISRLFPKPPQNEIDSHQKDENDGQVSKLNQKLQIVTNERDDLLERCQEYERKLSGLNNWIELEKESIHNTKLKHYEAKIAELTEECRFLKERNMNLNSLENGYKKQLEAKIDVLTKNWIELEKECSFLRARNMKNSLDNSYTKQLENEVDVLNHRLRKYDEKYNNLWHQLNTKTKIVPVIDLEAENEPCKDCPELKQKINLLENQFKNLLAEYAAKIAEYQMKVENFDTLESQVKDMRKHKQTIKENIEILENQVKELQEEEQKTKQENTFLKYLMKNEKHLIKSKSENQIKDLLEQEVKLKAENTSLKQKAERYKVDYKHLHKEYKKLKEKYEFEKIYYIGGNQFPELQFNIIQNDINELEKKVQTLVDPNENVSKNSRDPKKKIETVTSKTAEPKNEAHETEIIHDDNMSNLLANKIVPSLMKSKDETAKPKNADVVSMFSFEHIPGPMPKRIKFESMKPEIKFESN